jgi:anti-sigma factor ChrR (cupin superfamily)
MPEPPGNGLHLPIRGHCRTRSAAASALGGGVLDERDDGYVTNMETIVKSDDTKKATTRDAPAAAVGTPQDEAEQLISQKTNVIKYWNPKEISLRGR